MKGSIENTESMKEMATIVDRLSSLLRGIIGTAKEEIPSGAAEIISGSEEKSSVGEAAVEAATVGSNGEAKANKSELVRQYLKKHGHNVRNKDVVEAIKKETGVDVAPSLVSLLKGKASEKKPQAKRGGAPKVWTSKVVSGSSLIREYLESHGLEVSNEEVVKHVKKSKGADVKPTLVSSVRADLKRKGYKTSRVKVGGRMKVGGRGPTMTCAVVDTLKKAGKDGMELSEVTHKVMKSGYEYKGKKGLAGLTQNVFQALHNLSKKIAHPGFKGRTAIVIHEKVPGRRFGRYKLNPKAKVA